jgi:hypothetical protein
MNKIVEVILIFIFAYFTLNFLITYTLSPFTYKISLKNLLWNQRFVEVLAQAILIFASIIGILILEKW